MSTADDSSDPDSRVSWRFRQERLRLDLTHSEVSRLTGYARSSVISWEKGTTLPAAAIGELAPSGLDVQYVCTGVRSQNAGAAASGAPAEEPLSISEWKLVKRYRALGEAQQAQALAMLEVLAAGISMGGGSGNTVVVSGKGQRVAGGDMIKKRVTQAPK